MKPEQTDPILTMRQVQRPNWKGDVPAVPQETEPEKVHSISNSHRRTRKETPPEPSDAPITMSKGSPPETPIEHVHPQIGDKRKEDRNDGEQ